MTVTFFTEAVSEAPVKRDSGRYLVAIATPGQGSSGYYSESVLQDFGPVAFPAGAKSFINHESKRDMRDCIGVFPEGAYWDDERKQLMGELEVFEHWSSFVEAVHAHSGMSIYMAGTKDTEGNVTQLEMNVQNGADLVAYPGLAGSGFVAMLESARSAGEPNPEVSKAEESNNGKDAPAMEEKLDQLIVLMTALADSQKVKAEETAQVDADEKLAEERVNAFEAAVELIEAADVSAAQKKALRAAAKGGADVAPLIEDAKAIKAAILEEAGPLETQGGRVMGSETGFNTTSIWGA